VFPAADKARKEVTKPGLLNRVIDSRPVCGSGEGFQLAPSSWPRADLVGAGLVG